MAYESLHGNQNAVKLKGDELKLEAYKQYCAYIASGRGKEGWCFEHPELECTWRTMEKYIKDNPTVLQAFKKEAAEAKAFSTWEEKGTDMMAGKSKSETALYQMFMRNKFGWDREDRRQAESPREFDQQLEIIKPPV